MANHYWEERGETGRLIAKLLQSEMADVFGVAAWSKPHWQRPSSAAERTQGALFWTAHPLTGRGKRPSRWVPSDCLG